MTVKELRQSKFKVRVGHYRYTNVQLALKLKTTKFEGEPTLDSKITPFQREFGISPKGGKTTIEISKDGFDGKAEAICRFDENYNRKLGVKIALGRAFDDWQKKKSWPVMPNQKIKSIAPIKVTYPPTANSE